MYVSKDTLVPHAHHVPLATPFLALRVCPLSLVAFNMPGQGVLSATLDTSFPVPSASSLSLIA